MRTSSHHSSSPVTRKYFPHQRQQNKWEKENPLIADVPLFVVIIVVARPQLNIGSVVRMVVVDDHTPVIEVHHFTTPIEWGAIVRIVTIVPVPLHVTIVRITFPQLDVRPIPILVTSDNNAKSRILDDLDHVVVPREKMATTSRAFPHLHVLAVTELVGSYRQAIFRVCIETELVAREQRRRRRRRRTARDPDRGPFAPGFVRFISVARPQLNIGPVICMVIVDDHAPSVGIYYFATPIGWGAPPHVTVVRIAFPQLDIRPIPNLVTIDNNSKSRILGNLEEVVIPRE